MTRVAPVPGSVPQKSTAPAVTRSAALLGLLAEPESGPMGPTEISRRLKLPKSTVANLCAALERAQLVRNVEGRYELGPRLLELSAAYLSKVDIFQEFHGACRQLRWLSQEVVNMASLEDTDILVLARHYGSQSVRLAAGIGHRQAAYTTALGKAMLAQLDPVELAAKYSGQKTFMVLTANTRKNLAELMEDLDEIRERGYAIDHEENTLGLVSYAVSLPATITGRPPRAVSVSFLKAREDDELRERLVEDLRELADTLARHDRARHGPSGKS
jgi:IclR family transcriptional regulator, blcABC operon repressor